jgi:hypothetical protein
VNDPPQKAEPFGEIVAVGENIQACDVGVLPDEFF